MQEYLDNGLRLGWLIDPQARQVFVYRPGPAAGALDAPAEVPGAPMLPGFTLGLNAIWDPGL